MKKSIRWQGLALSVVVVIAAVVAACGQVTTGEDQQGQVAEGAVRAPRGAASLVAADVCANANDPSCTPTGAHGKHTNDCSVCHAVAGRLAFKVGGPAYGLGQPAPSFDAANKTCSNIGCHAVPAGVYNYIVWDWAADEGIPMQAPYGGTGQGPTPSWYASASSGGCTSCHNLKYNGTAYAWHSGVHGYYLFGQTVPNTVDPYNQCQSCHPNATGFIQENGTVVNAAITNSSLHANGVVNVQKKMNAGDCFGCH